MSSSSDSAITPEKIHELLSVWAAALVEYLDVGKLRGAKPGQVVNDILGPYFAPVGFDLEKTTFYREVFHEYGEEYPITETVDIQTISDIRPAMSLGVQLELTSTFASKLKIAGLGRLAVTRKEVRVTGFYIIEVTEAEPKEDAVNRSRKVEPVLREIILGAIAHFLWELLKKLGQL